MSRWLAKLMGVDAADAKVEFDLQNAPPAWVALALLIVVVIFVAWNYARESAKASPAVRVALALIRCAIIGLAALILCKPALIVRTPDSLPSTTIVLVDTSQSMTLADHYNDPARVAMLQKALRGHVVRPRKGEPVPGRSVDRETLKTIPRIHIVEALLNHPGHRLLRRLTTDKNRVRLFRFASGIKQLAADPASDTPLAGPLTAAGTDTRLGEGLRKAIGDLRGRPVSAVVILSDGQSNDGESPEQAARFAARQGIPIYTVGIGNPDRARDIELNAVEGPRFVFAGKDDVVTLRVFVRSQGYEDREVKIVVRRGEEILAEALVRLKDQEERQRFEIQLPVPTAGTLDAVVEIQPLSDESNADNNRLKYSLVVKDEKLKVLYVEGLPRWEYRYLRQALKRDVSVQASILLSTGPDSFLSDGDTQLDGFPEKEEDLFVYDVVIWGDLSPEILTGDQETLLARFIEEKGGGLLFIAGPRNMPAALSDNGDRHRKMKAMLPVVIESGDGGDEYEEGMTQSFQMQLTAEGQGHPLTRLHRDERKNRDVWANLPELFWHYPARKAKPLATVIAVHPYAAQGTVKRPLIALQYYGAGRTMFVGVDSLWRWRYLLGDRYHYRFYSQALRLLGAGKGLARDERVRLTVDPERPVLGRPVKLRLVMRERDGKAIVKDRVTVRLVGAGYDPQEVTLRQDENAPGVYVAGVMPPGAGAFDVMTDDIDAGDGTARKLASFRVTMPVLELRNPRMNEPLLRKIAALGAKGGRYINPDQLGGLTVEPRPRTQWDEREIPLFDHWMIFIAFFVLIVVEWAWRKYVRML